METAIIMTVAVLALLVCIGAAIMFVYMGGLVGGATMGFLIKRAVPPAPMPEAGAAQGMTADESNAIVAESQRLLRESQQRETFNKVNPL